MNVKELAAISSTLAPVIRDVVSREVTAHITSLSPAKDPAFNPEVLAVKAAELVRVPSDGKDGRDGSDAPAVDLDALALKAAELVTPPKDGRDGKDADADAIVAAVLQKAMPLFQESIEKAVSERLTAELSAAMTKAAADLPRPKDGRDGIDGAPGRDGEKGADGLSGKDGANGLGWDDLAVAQVDERTFAIKCQRGLQVKELGTLTFPVEIYRGVYVDGKTYDRGDGVTWGGSEWHCNETTYSKPGDGSKAWTLKVKRGRDGRDGKDGTPPPVPVVKR